MIPGLEFVFPGLQQGKYQVTSPKDLRYNCIAWAMGKTDAWWWPGDPDRTFWPEGVPRTATIEAFCLAFRQFGFEICENDASEAGFEKIALYADASGSPKHAARQISDNRWTSKLGRMEDIEHSLHDLAGSSYGTVVLFVEKTKDRSGRCKIISRSHGFMARAFRRGAFSLSLSIE